MTLLTSSLERCTVIGIRRLVGGLLPKTQHDKFYMSNFSPSVATYLPETSFSKEIAECGNPNIYTILVISTSSAYEALPFKHCWANSTLWKWAALPRALQQRHRKVRAFHTRQSPVHRLEPSQSEEVCKSRFHRDTIRMNYCGRKCLKLYILAARAKSMTQTYLVAPSDELFVVWSGELRV